MSVALFLFKLVAGAVLIKFAILLALGYEGVDRILSARMQSRIGPPLLQPF